MKGYYGCSDGSNKVFTGYVDATVVYQSSIWNKKLFLYSLQEKIYLIKNMN